MDKLALERWNDYFIAALTGFCAREMPHWTKITAAGEVADLAEKRFMDKRAKTTPSQGEKG